MPLLRSEPMKHGTLVIPSDRAREFIDLLGRRGCIQLVDMNEVSMNRQYKRYIQRIVEMERQLRFLFDLIAEMSGKEVVYNGIEGFFEAEGAYQLDRVEASLSKLYEQFVRFRDNNTDLLVQKESAVLEKHVIMLAMAHFDSRLIKEGRAHQKSIREQQLDIHGSIDYSANESLLSADMMEEGLRDTPDGYTPSIFFNTIAGVIPKLDQESLQRLLSIATRGNTYIVFDQIQNEVIDAKTKLPVVMSTFVIYFQGARGGALADKLQKICLAFGCKLFDWPANYTEGKARLEAMQETLKDREEALKAYHEYFTHEISVLLQLSGHGGNSLIEDWRLFCLKEKAAYAALNMFEGSDITLRALCWFPAYVEDDLRMLLRSRSNPESVSAFLITDDDSTVQHRTPPTLIKRNEFTEGFQATVDTFGIAHYQEINPGLFTIITLPFLFAVMYGDIGHGACLLLTALLLIYFKSRLKKGGETMEMLLSGRYVLLLMGCFSLFTGLMYNEVFGIGLNLFSSRWIDVTDPNGLTQLVPSSTSPYPIGFDPIWKSASNELSFTNSFKMKFSILVAFFHMGLGIVLKGANDFYFRNKLDFIFDFIPRLLFFCAFIGYANFLVVLKWLQPVEGYNKPSIINLLIQMVMFAPLEESDIMYPMQGSVQTVLIYIIIIALPIMLIPKPAIELYQLSKRNREIQRGSYTQIEIESEDGGFPSHGEERGASSSPSAGEIIIVQTIETVEFALSTLSNTASYLRLWALSLAHQQLSILCLEKIILVAFDSNSSIFVMLLKLIALVPAFAIATFLVLLAMGTIECFLHAIRLQWVEFHNKFYKADGNEYVAFSYRLTFEA